MKKTIIIIICVTALISLTIILSKNVKSPKETTVVDFEKCLPYRVDYNNGMNARFGKVKLDTVVSADVAVVTNVQPEIKKTYVREKLMELEASCKGDVLVDGGGRQIVFGSFQYCGGIPEKAEFRKRREEKLKSYQDEYTVVDLTCNPNGDAIP